MDHVQEKSIERKTQGMGASFFSFCLQRTTLSISNTRR
jgi:hypothetical protein